MAGHIELQDNDAHADYRGSKIVAWAVFALTALLLASDYIDRSIIVSMLPHIKAEWLLTDTQLGGLVSIVAVTVALFAIPVAILADRWSQAKCIFIMALVWSLATVGGWFATSYWQLLSLRGLVGIGEAGYGSVGMALLAGFFPSRLRATILASFNALAILGSILGVFLGGVIAKHFGWHAAFGIVGVPGLLLALLYVFVPDHNEGARATATAKSKLDLPAMARTLVATPSAIVLYIANACQLFLMSTIGTWLPSYFNRTYGLATDQAGARTAIILAISILGAVLWGLFADRMSRNNPSNKILVMALSGFTAFLAFGAAFAVASPGPLQLALIGAGALLMAGTVGTQAAAVIAIVHPGVRSTAMAVGSLIQSLFGLAAGPFLAGAVSDRYGLSAALALVPVFGLLSAIAFLSTLRLYKRDLEHAARRDEKPAAPTRIVAA